MPAYIDQIGQKVWIDEEPKRIISLVPSQTELLYDLGLEDRVVGITKFCVHPKRWFYTKERVGGTKNVNIEKVWNLNPDLIIANKEENNKADIDQLKGAFPVWTSEVKDLESNLNLIHCLGEILNLPVQSNALNDSIKMRFNALNTDSRKSLRVAYVIWNSPLMVAGGDTFINSMIEICGWENVFSNKMRYPTVTMEELQSLHLDVLLLSSEPFPFKAEHVETFQKSLSKSKIQLVNGEMFSWYGSRMLLAPQYLSQLIDTLN